MRFPRLEFPHLLRLTLSAVFVLAASHAAAPAAPRGERSTGSHRVEAPKAAPAPAAPVVYSGPRATDYINTAPATRALPSRQPVLELPADAARDAAGYGVSNASRSGIESPRTIAPTPTGMTGWDATAQAHERALEAPSSGGSAMGPGAGQRIAGQASPAGTIFRTTAAPMDMLCVVSDPDDAAFRAAVAGYTGGLVDYFNAEVATPTVGAMLAYDCVYVLPNAPFADPVLLGNNLADYVDNGGKVILTGAIHTVNWGVQGRIRNPGYDPVTTSDGWGFLGGAYAADGTTAYFAGITAATAGFRENTVVLQGPGVADGTYSGSGDILLAYRPDGRVVYTNGTSYGPFGGSSAWPKIVANACMLARPGAGDMLYVVGDVDDANFRSDIALHTRGIVDYFNGSAGTPSAGLLATYDCAFVHPNFQFDNAVLLGDRVADFVDAGGQAILGILSHSSVWQIQGRIRTPAYDPVTTGGAWNFGPPDAYAGNGTTSYYAGVLNLTLNFQEPGVVVQGAGAADGNWLGTGEILLGYRPDGRVVYVNGTGHVSWGPGGDWAKLIAQTCMLQGPAAPTMLYAFCDVDDANFRFDTAMQMSGIVDYFNANVAVPSLALMNTYQCVFTHPNAPYFDATATGDNLADFVDAGGKAILGIATTFGGFAIGGRISTPAYMPVFNPTGAIDLGVPHTYLGDGSTPLYTGVGGFSVLFRDYVAVQGAGKVDGHYVVGEIAGAYRPDGKVVYLNGTGHQSFSSGGDWPRLLANACMQDLSSGQRILYAPSEADDPAYRAAIAALTGGGVDYFDARSATPSAALLSGYDCVYTWANSPYSDRVLFGNRLADYVDAGGKVVLGVFCTYTSGNSLGGRIMTPGYSPVTSPLGINHFTLSTYAFNGTTCLHHGVVAYDQFYRDVLVPQGGGIVDGNYADGEIAVAYRPDRRVVYLNGEGNSVLGFGSGDWPQLVANACECEIGAGQLFASSGGATGDLFNLDLVTGKGYLVGPLPAASTELEFDPAAGRLWMQYSDGLFLAQEVSVANGSAVGPTIFNGAAFNGLEYALDRMWGGWIAFSCAPATFGTLDPATGASVPVLAAAWPRPLSGLAFDYEASTMYAVSGCGAAGPSEFLRIDVTTGIGTPISVLPTQVGGLQFGPDGDLYAGGNNVDGGRLYRINPTTGVSALVGPSGFGGISGLTLVPNTAVAADGVSPGSLSLAAPFPNPSVAGLVRLEFTLPQAGDANIELYNVAGRRVWSRAMGSLPAGRHSAEWNGFDNGGRRAPSGVYFVRLRTSMGDKRVSLVRMN